VARDLFDLIDDTPRSTGCSSPSGSATPTGCCRRLGGIPPNVWLGATIVNQEEAERDVPKLLATPARVRFVSYEPALGEVDWSRWLDIGWSPTLRRFKPLNGMSGMKKLDWIIVGGESTQGAPARDFRVEWALRTVSMCRAAGVPVFVKQLGSRVLDRNDAGFDGCDARSWPLRADGCDPDVEHEPHGYRRELPGRRLPHPPGRPRRRGSGRVARGAARAGVPAMTKHELLERGAR
jgi:protein gp37